MFNDDFDSADKMYKQLFRSAEPTKASELLNDLLEDSDGVLEYALNAFEAMFDVVYDSSLLFYTTCNYKGEGEGYRLFDEVKDLPVFVSKRESFNMFLG